MSFAVKLDENLSFAHVNLLARSRSASAVTEVLARVAAEISLEDLRGCLAVANLFFTRIRRPPR
jgi:hypothetical protein